MISSSIAGAGSTHYQSNWNNGVPNFVSKVTDLKINYISLIYENYS